MDKQKKSNRTGHKTVSLMAVWAVRNREKIEGKHITDVRSLFYKHFHPAPSIGSIDQALEAAEVSVVRVRGPAKGHRSNTSRYLAKCIVELCNAMEELCEKPILQEEMRHRLSDIIGGRDSAPPT